MNYIQLSEFNKILKANKVVQCLNTSYAIKFILKKEKAIFLILQIWC